MVVIYNTFKKVKIFPNCGIPKIIEHIFILTDFRATRVYNNSTPEQFVGTLQWHD